ncbi:hypothetical protein [Ureaplasma canigenitalium]|uniref:hypothetical protein n=1 Tax=Ureaplasma canigenitalium TaxID=42092 RepID=UPI00068EFBC1|nr:hypothetical protein [Ureaplasma canigenitalium]
MTNRDINKYVNLIESRSKYRYFRVTKICALSFACILVLLIALCVMNTGNHGLLWIHLGTPKYVSIIVFSLIASFLLIVIIVYVHLVKMIKNYSYFLFSHYSQNNEYILDEKRVIKLLLFLNQVEFRIVDLNPKIIDRELKKYFKDKEQFRQSNIDLTTLN